MARTVMESLGHGQSVLLWVGNDSRGNKTMAPAPMPRQRRSSCESRDIRPADGRAGSVRRQPGRCLQLDFLEVFERPVSDIETGQFANQAPVFVETGRDE